MSHANINQLLVLHRARDNAGSGMPDVLRDALYSEAFFVSTCMREFAVLTGTTASALPRHSELQRFAGSAAYAFLLQTVTGLNSSIPGETNVQGQVRKAWDNWRHDAPSQQLAALDPVMHLLFTDAREIRRQFLHGIGGHSYGSLVRKLLNLNADARVLFVGAGDLARSIAPFFAGFDTAYWNRHATDASGIGTGSAFAPHAAVAAACWATHVILTTPPDPHNDRKWSELLSATPTRQQVVHLGIRRAQRGHWESFEAFSDLDDIVELRQSQSSLRMLNINRARRACDDRAHARASASLSIAPHRRTQAA